MNVNEPTDQLARGVTCMPFMISVHTRICRDGKDIEELILSNRKNKERWTFLSSQIDLKQTKLLLYNHNRKWFELCIGYRQLPWGY